MGVLSSLVHSFALEKYMKKGLNSYQLKLIALCFMILDHLYSNLNWPMHEYMNWPFWPQWIPVITRFVSPLFLYLMIDGFYHTRSRRKLLTRLSAVALIMLVGNVILNYIFHNVDTRTGEYTFRSLINGNNIFLTLAVLFAFVWCLENIKQRNKVAPNVVLAVAIGTFSLFLEGGLELLPVTLIVWFFHERKALQCVGICVWSGLLLAKALFSYFTGPAVTSLYTDLCFDNEWAMFVVIFFILLYNGERGKNTKFSKYLFYVIYPIHLWILEIVRNLIIP